MIKTLLSLRFQAFLHQLTNSARRSKNNQGGGKGKLILYLFLYAYVFVVFAMMFGSALLTFGMIAFPLGQDWLFFSMYVLLAFMLMFIGSVFTTKSQLFEAKDNEFLLSMPIRPREIFMSRMVSLLLINFVLELAVAVPAAIVYGMYGNGSVFSWCFFVLTTLALPFFSFAISSVLAWLLSLMNAKIKNSAWVTTGLYVVFFLGYFYLISDMEKYLEYFLVSGQDIMLVIRNIAPIYWFGSAIANANPLHLLLSLLIYLVPFAIAFAVLSHSFLKICTIKPRAAKAKEKGSTVGKARSTPQALLLREFKHLTSSSTYLLNCGLGVVMMLIAMGALVINRTKLLSLLVVFPPQLSSMFGLLIMLALCMLNATCFFTAPSISIEGNHFAILRMLPIRTEEILRAKLKTHLWIMLPVDLLCSIITVIVFPMSLPLALTVLFAPSLYTVWIANIGLIWGLHFPILDWSNEAVAVKQGTAVMLTMLFASFPAIILGAGSIALAMISPWLSLALWIVATVLADVLTYRYLMRGGVVRFEEIPV